MRHSHLTLAFAFFCGFQAPAQTIASIDSTSSAPAKSDSTIRVGSSNRASKDDESPPAIATDSLRTIPFNLGIAPGTASNGKHPQDVFNHVSLDLVAGEAGAIRGIQLSGAMNELHGPMTGLQATAGLNHVTGNVSGFQASTVNIVEGDVKGYQGAYVLNRVNGDVKGYQGSSFGNLVSGDVTGMQSSAFYGSARTVRGLQLNGVCVADTLYGTQWGLVNVAGRAKGVQFGLVNVAKNDNVAQIGLVNVHPGTRIYAESWVDETRSAHVAMNYGGPNFYSLVEFVGSERTPHANGLGLGFGARVASPKTILSIDQSFLFLGSADQAQSACEDDDDMSGCDMNIQFRTRLVAGRHVYKRLAFFGGVSYNVLVAPEENSGRKLLEPERAYHYDPNDVVRLWPGVFVGVRI